VSIFALAARHANENDERFKYLGKGAQFLAKAKELLLREMAEGKPKIPTIQGLLILGGRQSTVGRSSESRLYTGIAIRMMIDVGLHLDTQKLVESEILTPADLKARKRLYLSAYIWDKTLSLSIGRPSSLTRLPDAIDDMLDDLDDQEEPWKPVCLTGIQDIYCSSFLQHLDPPKFLPLERNYNHDISHRLQQGSTGCYFRRLAISRIATS
jgi:hypothetical protein